MHAACQRACIFRRAREARGRLHVRSRLRPISPLVEGDAQECFLSFSNARIIRFLREVSIPRLWTASLREHAPESSASRMTERRHYGLSFEHPGEDSIPVDELHERHCPRAGEEPQQDHGAHEPGVGAPELAVPCHSGWGTRPRSGLAPVFAGQGTPPPFIQEDGSALAGCDWKDGLEFPESPCPAFKQNKCQRSTPSVGSRPSSDSSPGASRRQEGTSLPRGAPPMPRSRSPDCGSSLRYVQEADRRWHPRCSLTVWRLKHESQVRTRSGAASGNGRPRA